MSQIPTSEHMYCKYMYGSGTHDITKKLFSVFSSSCLQQEEEPKCRLSFNE